MRIYVEREKSTDSGSEDVIILKISGSPGDKKQPVDYLYFSASISRVAASKLALALKRATEQKHREEIEI